MTSASLIERAQTRYAHAVYRSALLRDPHPGHAAAAVVAAFAAQDWASFALDDNSEARLIASLPAVRRWPVRRRAALAPLPASFWRLPAATRLALGLRLGRGFSTAQIAQALKQPPETVGDLLIDGLAAVAELELPPTVECRAFRHARLDDPAADRSHLIGCASCRRDAPAWEAAETRLADQFGRAVGGMLLPPSSLGEVQALQTTGGQPAPATWRTPWRLQLALLGVIGLGLAALLLWPRAKNPPTASSAANTADRAAQANARQIVSQAQAQYTALPTGTGVIHRRWEVQIERLALNVQAEEWVDSEQPARHRMQLLNGREVVEWQLADGAAEFNYLARRELNGVYCGSPSAALITNYELINRWAVEPSAQAELRTARWQSGPWAIGWHYLQLAASADTLHSLGVAGTGDQAVLTLAAEGSTISGTLLLRLDPQSYELQQVRVLQTDNGQTKTLSPWRLVLHESLDQAAARQQGAFSGYPSARWPLVREINGAILDPACPLLTADLGVSLPLLLAHSGGAGLPGLRTLPSVIDHITLFAQSDFNSAAGAYQNAVLVYRGAGKRLAFSPLTAVLQPAASETIGPWFVRISRRTPNVLVAQTMLRTDEEPKSGFQVWAEGWTENELRTVLQDVGYLHLRDWLAQRSLLYDPVPFEPAVLAALEQIVPANATLPATTYQRAETTTFLVPPYLTALDDPYHRSIKEWPPVRHKSVLIGVNAQGAIEHFRLEAHLPSGKLTSATWTGPQPMWSSMSGGVVQYSYNGMLDRSFISPPRQVNVLPEAAILFALAHGATWRTLDDGAFVAEVSFAPGSQLVYDLLGSGLLVDATEQPWLDNGAGQYRYRSTWKPDGHLRSMELFNDQADGSAILIVSVTITAQATMPPQPASAYVLNDAPGSRIQIGAGPILDQRNPPELVEAGLSAIADRANFSAWDWPTSSGVTQISVQGSARPAQGPVMFEATIDEAPALGVAASLTYLVDDQPVSVIQGLGAVLRPMLERTYPRWQTSQARPLIIDGREHKLWVMDWTHPDRQWAVLELDQTLLLLSHDGQPEQFEALVDRFALLRPLASGS